MDAIANDLVAGFALASLGHLAAPVVGKREPEGFGEGLYLATRSVGRAWGCSGCFTVLAPRRMDREFRWSLSPNPSGVLSAPAATEHSQFRSDDWNIEHMRYLVNREYAKYAK